MFERTICNLCNADDTKALWFMGDTFNTSKNVFTVARCKKCKLVYVNPRPPKEEILNYYSKEYPSYIPSEGVTRLLKKFLLSRETSFLNKEISTAGEILEVGTGVAEDLAYIKEKTNLQVFGIDISHDAARASKTFFNLDIEVGELEDKLFSANRFDIVRLKYVLSHVYSPDDLLKEIYRVLKPRGLAMIWVPNFNSINRWLFRKYWQGGEAPRHLYSFDPSTLSRYLEQSGFTVSKIKHSIVPNTFIHSFREYLRGIGAPKFIVRIFNLNLFSLILFLPLALFASLIRKSDRIVVIAYKDQ